MRFSTVFLPVVLAALQASGVSAGDESIGSTSPRRPGSPTDPGSLLAAGGSPGSRSAPATDGALPPRDQGMIGFGPIPSARNRKKFPQPNIVPGPDGTAAHPEGPMCIITLVRPFGRSESLPLRAGVEGIPDGWSWKWRKAPYAQDKKKSRVFGGLGRFGRTSQRTG
ncbi:hypothetical protein MGG_08506 [Pyricularia oryzae 70-15]|uniref:Uncharacterized protein n=3 Tax=Pyricularia oryzae TaxID=318829 RepID=G4NAQ0_PYRO7|nr:uncharacterized protein MGG_08506 [Pyricularia oryzae 70-15]EHA49693.1 hypothetical protein MGG_08506 [Pyricularia oryzae 70-15]ELQ42956.1 hypothetical protein OOU_Y34scaffold00181g2 [Pyricularia oryzae Y34]KAI7909464.1 hypothetical protein M9X92_011622 [Pyricularia oryzae]KAI7909860.1 hypothetical protein M0657_011649 [Pyricularia oryzae]